MTGHIKDLTNNKDLIPLGGASIEDIKEKAKMFICFKESQVDNGKYRITDFEWNDFKKSRGKSNTFKTKTRTRTTDTYHETEYELVIEE